MQSQDSSPISMNRNDYAFECSGQTPLGAFGDRRHCAVLRQEEQRGNGLVRYKEREIRRVTDFAGTGYRPEEKLNSPVPLLDCRRHITVIELPVQGNSHVYQPEWEETPKVGRNTKIEIRVFDAGVCSKRGDMQFNEELQFLEPSLPAERRSQKKLPNGRIVRNGPRNRPIANSYFAEKPSVERINEGQTIVLRGRLTNLFPRRPKALLYSEILVQEEFLARDGTLILCDWNCYYFYAKKDNQRTDRYPTRSKPVPFVVCGCLRLPEQEQSEHDDGEEEEGETEDERLTGKKRKRFEDTEDSATDLTEFEPPQKRRRIEVSQVSPEIPAQGPQPLFAEEFFLEHEWFPFQDAW